MVLHRLQLPNFRSLMLDMLPGAGPDRVFHRRPFFPQSFHVGLAHNRQGAGQQSGGGIPGQIKPWAVGGSIHLQGMVINGGHAAAHSVENSLPLGQPAGYRAFRNDVVHRPDDVLCRHLSLALVEWHPFLKPKGPDISIR